MDKMLSTLASLHDARRTIDELIDKVKEVESDKGTDTRKLLIIVLSVIGALVVVAFIAYAVYHHFSDDYLDDYEDLDDVFEDEDDEEDDEDDEEEDDEPESEGTVYDDDFVE